MDIRNVVENLFASSADASRRAREVDALVSSQLERFLATSTHGGALPLAELAAAFADSSIPESPRLVDDYLSYLFAEVVPNSVRTHSPRFIGHMTSALPSFTDALGRVVNTLNQNVVKLETSNAFTFYERQALAMLHRLTFGLDEGFYAMHVQRSESTLGLMVSGGTLANLAALWVARNRSLGPDGQFPGVETEGLASALLHHGCKRAVVVGSSLMHYSLRKAVDLLGLGARGLIAVPADETSRVSARAVRDVVIARQRAGERVIAIVAVAGTTETGGVDPLAELADVADELDVHLHVDAAWGGPVLFSRRHRHRLAGIERADTVTIDGHKQLYVPMGIGTLLLKDPEAARSIEKVAQYIIRADSPDLGRRTLEGSRPAMAIFLHAALHIIGRAGYEALVDNGIDKCRFMADQIAQRPEFELLSDPTLNILVYRYLPAAHRARRGGFFGASENNAINAVNRALQEAQWRSGAGFISRTTLHNTRYGSDVPITSLRAVIANPLTTVDDISAVLDEQVELGDGLAV